MISHKKIKKAADLMPTDVRSQQILSELAMEIAKPHIQTHVDVAGISYVQFNLGKEKYGVPYATVKEVLKINKLSPVPFVPNYIAGVINRHGILLSVIDLKLFFNFTNPTVDDASEKNLLIIESKQRMVGLLVDVITGSGVYLANQLAPSLPTTHIKADYVLGLHEHVVAVLNVENILTALFKNILGEQSS